MIAFVQLPEWLQTAIGLTALILGALISNFIAKNVILRVSEPILDKRSKTPDKAAFWLATSIPLVIMSRGILYLEHLPENFVTVVHNIAEALIVISFAMALIKAITYANELYERRPHARNRPIKGYLQVLKIIVACGAAIILISILINQSPAILLKVLF